VSDESRQAVRAFTLMELVVVVAVIAVLAAILLPAFQRVLGSGRATACVSNLRQLSVALNTYLADNNNMMPILKAGREKLTDEVPVIDNTLDKYAPDKAVFTCPADSRFAAATGTSYFWNVAINGQALGSLNFMGLVDQHSRIPILGDKEGFHPYLKNKVNILYADGHASKDIKFFTAE
jgi:prepilin-type N-terminal cleavage/methylation domain-containing protein/prepilin-type processing-associated H-X9-DG protein